MIEQNKIQILLQIVETMGEISKKMENAVSKGNKEEYEKAKEEILKFQKKTSEVLENEH